MAVAFNRVFLAGNLTKDPQTRFIANEKAVCNFGIAVNKRYKGKDGEMKEDVTFVDIEAWGRTAELVGQYLTKGKSCLVEGSLKLDTWEKDGQKHQKLKVVADGVQFLGGKGEIATSGTSEGEKSLSNKSVDNKTTLTGGITSHNTGDEPPFDKPFDIGV